MRSKVCILALIGLAALSVSGNENAAVGYKLRALADDRNRQSLVSFDLLNNEPETQNGMVSAGVKDGNIKSEGKNAEDNKTEEKKSTSIVSPAPASPSRAPTTTPSRKPPSSSSSSSDSDAKDVGSPEATPKTPEEPTANTPIATLPNGLEVFITEKPLSFKPELLSDVIDEEEKEKTQNKKGSEKSAVVATAAS